MVFAIVSALLGALIFGLYTFPLIGSDVGIFTFRHPHFLGNTQKEIYILSVTANIFVLLQFATGISAAIFCCMLYPSCCSPCRIQYQQVTNKTYFCHCAYVLRIFIYSGFLWVVLPNTGIFWRGLKPRGESRTYQAPLLSKLRKFGGNRAFFRDSKASIWKKTSYIEFVFYCFLE